MLFSLTLFGQRLTGLCLNFDPITRRNFGFTAINHGLLAIFLMLPLLGSVLTSFFLGRHLGYLNNCWHGH